MSESSKEHLARGRSQDLYGLVLCALGGLFSVSIALALVGRRPEGGALTAPIVGLITALGPVPGLFVSLGASWVGVMLFLGRRGFAPGRPLLGLLGGAIGLALFLGVLRPSAGGSLGQAIPGALPGKGAFVLGLCIGGIVFVSSIWNGVMGRRTGARMKPDDAQGLMPAARPESSDGVSLAEAAALIPRASQPRAPTRVVPEPPAAEGSEARVERSAPAAPFPPAVAFGIAMAETRRAGGVPEGARPLSTTFHAATTLHEGAHHAARGEGAAAPRALSPAEPAGGDLAAQGKDQRAAGQRKEPAGRPETGRERPEPHAFSGERSSLLIPPAPPAASSEIPVVPSWERAPSADELFEPTDDARADASGAPSWLDEEEGEDELAALELPSEEEQGEVELVDEEELLPEPTLARGAPELDRELEELEEEGEVALDEDDEDDAGEDEDESPEPGALLAELEAALDAAEEPRRTEERAAAGAAPPAGLVPKPDATREQVGLFDVLEPALPGPPGPEPALREAELEPRPARGSKRAKPGVPAGERVDPATPRARRARKSSPEKRSPAGAEPEAPRGSEGAREQEPSPTGAARAPIATAKAPEDEERLVFDAGCLILEQNRVAVSMLERHFGLDFDRACIVLDRLQDRGLIGPYVGGRTRDILLTREEWTAMAENAS